LLYYQRALVPADHHSPHRERLKNSERAPELNHLSRDHWVPAALPENTDETRPQHQIRASDIQDRQVFSVIYMPEQIKVGGKNTKRGETRPE
jgi:hypothetical protein